ncbi:MAG: hypothetical protein WA252_14565 [Candidatus Sulfotelmatobacter sp.]
MKVFRTLAVALLTLLAWSGIASSQSPASPTWQNLTNKPTFAVDTALQLTDGTVMVHEYFSENWWRLTPDNTGSYINGTWSQLASMPVGYAPLYFASAVLADGNVIVEGGEYNNGSDDETNLGAYYNSSTNTWTSVSAPPGWSALGDGASAVLPDGTFMVGNCGVAGTICSPFEKQQALLDESTLTWTITGTGKNDQNSEEGWTLLPNGDVLTVDTWSTPESELYNPSTGDWSLAGDTPTNLVNPCVEIGPAVLRPDGTVWATGGESTTAIYNSSTGVWSNGPSFAKNSGITDGPAALLPDGNVLVSVGPSSCYDAPSKFYEFNGTNLIAAPAPTGSSSNPTYIGRMLVLPTGQVLFTEASGSKTTQIYVPTGTYKAAWQPTITSVATKLTAGSTDNVIEGTQFNGLSQGAMYGDDAQMATNYPLVRIENAATKNIVYCRTHNHSTMGVATGSTIVSTEFDVPATIGTGLSELFVVANGIPSKPVKVDIEP